MTDILGRLRSDSQRHDVTPDGRDYTYTATPSALEKEAADEIERLRADNARLRAALRDVADAYEWWGEDQYDRDQGVVGDAIFAARRALEGKE